MAREVGTEGMLGGQAEVEGVSGTWKDLTDSVNFMAVNLTDQVRNIAAGDDGGGQRRPVAEDHRRGEGRGGRAGGHINTMVDTLAIFAAEVTRVAREVGTEGNLGGQAEVPSVAGTWKDLTDNVNFMASQPDRARCETSPRSRRRSPTATCRRRSPSRRKGEMAELADTINTMVDTLAVFADRGDARGARGGHRGQAGRPGRRAGRRRHVEGPDRLRELDGRQPDRPGAQHRRRHDRGGERATCRRRSRST